MFTRKILFILLPYVLLIIVSVILFKQCTTSDQPEDKEEKQVVTHKMVIDKIEAIGKLELVKYYIKDIVEHTTEMNWWPDPKVVLIISGEAIGCVDLTSIDSTDISFTQEEVTVILPNPEVCVFKINHKESKVYNLEDQFMDEGKLIDRAYTQAEAQIKSAALKMGILEETKKNADRLLKPLLQNVTGKKVTIVFK